MIATDLLESALGLQNDKVKRPKTKSFVCIYFGVNHLPP